MKYGICELPYIPLRAESSHRSEMTSQVLFGEKFKIISKREKWSQIELIHDNYSGYIENKAITEIEESNFNETIIFENSNNVLLKNDTEKIIVPMGSIIPTTIKDNVFSIKENKYKIISEIKSENSQKDKKKFIYEKSLSLLNTSYLWGGRTEWGLDCSGFSQLIYRLIGIEIPRDADKQSLIGSPICFFEEAELGDLAFFENEEKEIVHVGIIFDKNKIIHCSTYVKIDIIDHNGIFDKKRGGYSHQLSIIKKIF